MRKIIIVITILVLIGSLAWLISAPSYEPLVASLAALGTLVGLFVEKEMKRSNELEKVETRGNEPEKVKAAIIAPSEPSKHGSLSGEIEVGSDEDEVYEVYYKRPFKRIPQLELKRSGTLYGIKPIEQRADGFKIKGRDVMRIVKWTASGEFED